MNMGIWEDIFGHPPDQPSQAVINAALIQNLRDKQRNDPQGYWLSYGTATPEQALYMQESPGAFERDASGNVVYDASGNPKRRSTALTAEELSKMQAEIDAQNAANAPPPEAPPPEQPPDQPPPSYSGPNARQKLEALLPPGFDVTALPDTFGSPFVESTQASARRNAQEFIANMLRRQTITPEGAEKASASLGTQDPSVREKLANLSNVMLAGERSRLRGIAGEGYTAAGQPGETGEFFNATPYQERVQSEVGRFQTDFPGKYSTESSGISYDVSGLPGAGGAVTSPANVAYDPYAVAGGRLSSGTEDETASQYNQKKRTTSVF